MFQIRRGTGIILDNYSYFSIKTYFMTHHYNRLIETVLMRGHNICFCLEIRKIIFELSSLPPLIWSSALQVVLTQSTDSTLFVQMLIRLQIQQTLGFDVNLYCEYFMSNSFLFKLHVDVVTSQGAWKIIGLCSGLPW